MTRLASKIIFLFCFVSLLNLVSCGTTIKTLVGFKNPKVETKATVLEYLDDNKIEHDTYFRTVKKEKDSIEIYRNLIFGFNSEILIFDKNGTKYCYNGNEECSGVQLRSAFENFESNYKPCIDTTKTVSLDLFLSRLQDKNGNPILKSDLPDADYYFFNCWNKYAGRSKMIKEDIDWLYELNQNTSNKIEIILINTDLLEEWGLEEGGELPLKFRKHEGGLRMTFGALPIKA